MKRPQPLNPVSLLKVTSQGLFCSAGDFYIDPWKPVRRAVITHAHGDHARTGSGEYFAASSSVPVLHHRIGEQTKITPKDYGKQFQLGEVTVSFHPAGHILGSSQVRIEHRGEVWVMSGDYKRAHDPTCEPFEIVECDTFITESTFGLPIYRWKSGAQIAQEIFTWWEQQRSLGRTAVLFCYALGKAQRVLAELQAFTDRTVLTHGAVESLTSLYRRQGVSMLPTKYVSETDAKTDYAGELVIAPPSAAGTAWLRRFKNIDTGFASGWMQVRGNRRRNAYDRGFVMSDHADWPSLLKTIAETKAKKVLITHGASDVLVRYLQESGTDAQALATAFGEEEH